VPTEPPADPTREEDETLDTSTLAQRYRFSEVEIKKLLAGEEYLTRRSWGISLYEFAPAQHRTRLRVKVQVRQDSANAGQLMYGEAGLYFGYRRLKDKNDVAQVFATFTFRDLAPAAMKQSEGARKGSWAELYLRRLSTPGWSTTSASLTYCNHLFYVPENPATPPGPWRQLQLDITTDAIQLSWDGAPLPKVSVERLVRLHRFGLNNREGESQIDPRIFLDGSIGLLLNGSDASIRQLEIDNGPRDLVVVGLANDLFTSSPGIYLGGRK
jgi:hypothetical protein